MNTDCIFCKIVSNQAPSSVVYEDHEVLAFMDIRPVNVGHTLIIPKQHFVDVFDVPDELLGKIYTSTKRIAKAVKKVVEADGISIVQQNGSAAGQDIFHFHVHVIPRFEGAKIPRFHELSVASRQSLDEIAARIRSEM